MINQSMWHCAVLRGWTPEYGQALTPVATIAWKNGATLSEIRSSWVPISDSVEADAASTWRARLFLADADLPVDDFLAYHGERNETSIVLCTVPLNSTTLTGVTDRLLDEILIAPLTADLAEYWYSTSTSTRNAKV